VRTAVSSGRCGGSVQVQERASGKAEHTGGGQRCEAQFAFEFDGRHACRTMQASLARISLQRSRRRASLQRYPIPFFSLSTRPLIDTSLSARPDAPNPAALLRRFLDFTSEKVVPRGLVGHGTRNWPTTRSEATRRASAPPYVRLVSRPGGPAMLASKPSTSGPITGGPR
jgi:hypothetical protein